MKTHYTELLESAKQLQKIVVYDEILLWLNNALADRLGRALTLAELDQTATIAGELQAKYKRLVAQEIRAAKAAEKYLESKGA